MRKKRIAVILINWNSFDTTNDCINSLKEVSDPDFDIVVVDNASADQSGDQLASIHPDIILIKSPVNAGFTGGNNIGFRYSLDNGYEFSLMQNNDTFVAPDYLSPLIDYMNNHPQTAVVQPRIFYHPNRHILWDGGSYFNHFIGHGYTKGLGKTSSPKYEQEKQVDWVTGCAFFVRNSVLKEVGLLSENMFMNWEDVDLSFRIKQKGYQLAYIPSSIIYHITSMSLKSSKKGDEGFLSPAAHYRNIRNRIWILKRYTPWYFALSVIFFNFFYILLVIGYFALRRRFVKLKAVVNGVRDGLSGSINYVVY
ncbi:MAG: hypothetical protein RLZZ28_706 [Bacteroidota bacterium]|jgi:GT2 family glycosyltransferase